MLLLPGRTGVRLNLEFLSLSSPVSKLPSRKLFKKLNGFSYSNILLSQNTNLNNVSQSHANDLTKSELYVILEAVADNVEMHHNIGEQRDNWNTLLLSSINMITLAASTIVGVARFAAQPAEHRFSLLSSPPASSSPTPWECSS